MYYQSELIQPIDVAHDVDFPVTPSIALRALNDQIETYLALWATESAPDLFAHFEGPINPPEPGLTISVRRSILPVVSEYRTKILARAALLTSIPLAEQAQRIAHHGRISREMFAMEHALAIDMARTRAHQPLSDRERSARKTLAIAAYWCHRTELIGVGSIGAHPLLGFPPDDVMDGVIYDFALATFYRGYVSSKPLMKIDLDKYEMASNVESMTKN